MHTTAPYRPLNVAIVDEELPYPATSGKRIRTLNLLLRLADRHKLTFVSHRNAADGEASTAREYLEDHGIQVVTGALTGPIGSTGDGAGNWFVVGKDYDQTFAGRWYDGKIDGVRVYSRALDATEVKAHFQGQ